MLSSYYATTNSYLPFNYDGWWFTTSKVYMNATSSKFTSDGTPIYSWY